MVTPPLRVQRERAALLLGKTEKAEGCRGEQERERKSKRKKTGRRK